MEEGLLVFMKHLAQGSRGPASVQGAETHLADAVMGSGVGVQGWEAGGSEKGNK